MSSRIQSELFSEPANSHHSGKRRPRPTIRGNEAAASISESRRFPALGICDPKVSASSHKSLCRRVWYFPSRVAATGEQVSCGRP
jgi:hypothetical protein